jgi:hypothetical protein
MARVERGVAMYELADIMIKKAMLPNCLIGLPAMMAKAIERAAWRRMKVMAVVIPDIDLPWPEVGGVVSSKVWLLSGVVWKAITKASLMTICQSPTYSSALMRHIQDKRANPLHQNLRSNKPVLRPRRLSNYATIFSLGVAHESIVHCDKLCLG